MNTRPDSQLELPFSATPDDSAPMARVISFEEERRRREQLDRIRLEKLVSERWTGVDASEG